MYRETTKVLLRYSLDPNNCELRRTLCKSHQNLKIHTKQKGNDNLASGNLFLRRIW